MITELQVRYGVRSLSAVLKARNERSMRLLARLGFSAAPAGHSRLGELEAGEALRVLTLA